VYSLPPEHAWHVHAHEHAFHHSHHGRVPPLHYPVLFWRIWDSEVTMYTLFNTVLDEVTCHELTATCSGPHHPSEERSNACHVASPMSRDHIGHHEPTRVSLLHVPMEKNTGKIRVCIDFHNLNKATLKDECLIPIADMLINNASGHRVISFLDGNAGYN
jgi:hypothetical protein